MIEYTPAQLRGTSAQADMELQCGDDLRNAIVARLAWCADKIEQKENSE